MRVIYRGGFFYEIKSSYNGLHDHKIKNSIKMI
jgi:hypothetical protein